MIPLIGQWIARGLGVADAERESHRLLLACGLEQKDIDAILSNLASPILTPLEAVAVPYVRESIWPDVPQIQRRSREVMKSMTDVEFIELITSISIANGACRLAALVQPEA